MSEDIYAKPDLSKKVRFQTEEKEDGNADVYENIENVNIYDNYLPQGSSKPLELQDSTPEDPQKAVSVNAPSEGRNLLRPAAMFLLLLCLLFLAGVVVLVVLLIRDKGLNANLTRTRDELQRSYGEMKSLHANLTQKTNRLEMEKDHLTAIESNLTTEIDELRQQLGRSCCPANWDKFGKSCYLISTSEKKWEESKTFCEDQNAQLVIISSEQEQYFISSFRVIFWIGLSHEGGKIWKWVNGSVAMQTYWAGHQPDYYHNEENCANVQYFNSLTSWNDLNCNVALNFVCEKILE